MIDFTTLPAAPEPLRRLVLGDPHPAPQQRTVRDRLVARSRADEASGGGYGERALRDECEAVRRAPIGRRNHTLNAAAFSLFQLAQEGALDEGTVVDALTAAARECGLKGWEVERTLESGRRGAAARPRSANRLPSQRDIPVPAKGVFRPQRNGTDNWNRTASGTVPEPDEEDADPGLLELLSSHRGLHELWDMPDPVPLVADCLMLDSLALLWGAPGAKKSFIALDLSLCVATGMWWHGRKVEQGPVCYFVGEGLSGLKQRTKAWAKHNGVGLEKSPPGWHSYGKSFDLLGQGRRKAYHALKIVEEIKPRLVVIDTLHRHSPGANENDARDMGVIIDMVDQMREVTGGCVLLIHHSNKSGEAERGHTALLGAVDTSVKVTSDDVTTTIEWVKVKDAARPKPLKLFTCPVEHTGSIVLSDDYQGSEEADEGLLRRVAGELWLVRSTGSNVADLAAASGLGEWKVRQLLTRLEEKGWAKKQGAHSWFPTRQLVED